MENTHYEEYQVYGENQKGEVWERPVTTDQERAIIDSGELAEAEYAAGHWNRWVKIRRRRVTMQVGSWHDLPVG